MTVYGSFSVHPKVRFYKRVTRHNDVCMQFFCQTFIEENSKSYVSEVISFVKKNVVGN